MSPRITDINDVVEENVTKLFKTFRESPAIFLTEADVEAHLYSLLINEPVIRGFFPTLKNFSFAIESSKTFLVHVNMPVKIKSKNRKVDISIFQPKETLDWESEEFWDNMIGIEIKCNRRIPARDKSCGIIEDVRKVCDYKKGYVLWLNWNREIDTEDLAECKKEIKKYDNVKLFYLDMFSEPMKTNMPNM